MSNPVLVEVTRGGITESVHRGAFAVIGPGGGILAQAGNIDDPIFPRSAIKAFQALPLVESGAADAYGIGEEELALACASHNGENVHVRVARLILQEAGVEERLLECGAHPPHDATAIKELLLAGQDPLPIHNNCSGKHAGMLAVARKLGFEPAGYVKPDHGVQRGVARVLDELCGVKTAELPVGTDGCSVPTWAIPLRNLALGFHRFASGEGLTAARKTAAQRIIAAVRAHPHMVAGTGRFCTRLMQAVPRAFVKTGAEGVFCGAVPHAGLGIALKCDDGAHRASEVAMAAVLASLGVWTEEEMAALKGFLTVNLSNWRRIPTGSIRAVGPLPAQ